MLVLFCQADLDEEHMDMIRAKVKEKTGEDCLILGPVFTDIRQIQVQNDGAAPQ